MGLKSHLQLRMGLMFAGFFGGFILNTTFAKHLGALEIPLFFLLPFGGAFLLQFAFAQAVPAACPKCGGPSLAGKRSPTVYTCRNCNTRSESILTLFEEIPTLASIQAAPQVKTSRSRLMVWILLALGVVVAGVGAYLAGDSLRLLRDGVSAEARVMTVNTRRGTDRDGKPVTQYTAIIRYEAGTTPRTLIRSWSMGSSARCGWPCYEEGEPLRVIYLPDDPSSASIHSLLELFFTPGMFGLVGLVIVLVTGIMLRKGRA